MKTVLAVPALVLAAAAPALAQDAQQPNQTTETFGAWTVRCVTNVDAPDGRQCEVAHVVTGQNGQAIAQMAIGRGPDGATRVVVVTPLGMALATPVEIMGDAEGTGAASLPYATCLPNGCFAQMNADDAELAALAGTAGFKVAMTERTGRRIEMEMPTDGLTAGLARLAPAAE